jgi:hypothetical protein
MSDYKWLPFTLTKEMTESVKEFRYTCYDTTPEEVYTAMWKAAPEIVQTPDAYISERTGYGTKMSKSVDIAESWGVPYEPLYKHPQQRHKPLNEDEADALIDEALNLDNLKGWSMRFVRLVEKAHGIGVRDDRSN